MLIGKIISCTRNRQIMKFKTFRKLKDVILNIIFAIMIFLSHLSVFPKKFRVGKHEDLFIFSSWH